jgi:putative endonuclease
MAAEPDEAGRRRAAYRRGLAGEAAAVWLLRLKGYRILGRRVRLPVGEIDIVARRGAVVAFVEVKRRAATEDALTAITATGRRRIAAAARLWLSRHPAHAGLTLRFDLVVVARGRLPRHLVSAFEAEVW